MAFSKLDRTNDKRVKKNLRIPEDPANIPPDHQKNFPQILSQKLAAKASWKPFFLNFFQDDFAASS